MLPAIVIAAISNLDNLGVAVAIGIGGARVAATQDLIIAAATMGSTAAAMLSGEALSKLVATPTAVSLGALIVISAGACTVLVSLGVVHAPERSLVLDRTFSRRRHDRTQRMSYPQTLVLGVALSLNNVAAGIGAGVAGVPLVATTLFAGAFSLLCIASGSSGSRCFRERGSGSVEVILRPPTCIPAVWCGIMMRYRDAYDSHHGGC